VGWSATEPGGVGVVGGGQGGLAGFVDGVGDAEVDRRRAAPADAGVAVNMAIFVEESVQKFVRIAKECKEFRKVMDVFQGFELRLTEGLSLLVRGREWDRSMPRLAISSDTDPEVIGVPRSACTVCGIAPLRVSA
jgi:hypothetical protein